jgi:hypothetical protein
VTDMDLIDWTIQAAENLNTERREARGPDGKASLDEMPAGPERETAEDARRENPFAQLNHAISIQLAAESPIGTTSPEAVASSEPDVVLPTSPPPAPAANGRIDAQMSNLLQAIVEPDVNTARGIARSFFAGC